MPNEESSKTLYPIDIATPISKTTADYTKPHVHIGPFRSDKSRSKAALVLALLTLIWDKEEKNV